MRKPKTVAREIKTWEGNLATLQTDLDKAKSQEAKAEARRSKVRLLAKTGDQKANAKFAQLTDEWKLATQEKNDFEGAIEDCQEKLKGLEAELKQSKEAAGRDLIRECGKDQEKCLARIAKAMDEVVDAVHESRTGTDTLRKNLTALGFDELNIDSEITRVAVHSISQTLYGLFPRSGKFERPLSGYHRETPLVQMVQNLFKRFYDSRRQLIKDPYEGVIKVDLSNVRTVSDEELIQRGQLTEKMAAEAAELRGEGVPA